MQFYEKPSVMQALKYRAPVKRAINQKKLSKNVGESYRLINSSVPKYAETEYTVNGRGLIIGDSFSEGTFDFWSRQFSATLSATIHVLKGDPGRFPKLVEQFDPDHVVLIYEETKFTPIGKSNWHRVAKMMTPTE